RIVFAASLAIALGAAADAWPLVAAGLSTTEPLASQIVVKTLGAIAATLFGALLAGLCAGVGAFGARASPPLARIGGVPAVVAAIAAGAFVVGLQTALGALAAPEAPRWPQSPWASLGLP